MHIEVFDLCVPTTDDGHVLKEKVWPKLRPEWKLDHINAKVFTMGHLNKMTLYYSAEDIALQDALVVRLFGNRGAGYESRHLEFVYMQRSYYAGTGPELCGVLQNGIIYRYTKGRTFKEEDIRNPRSIRAAARALAQLHWCDVTQRDLIDMTGQPYKLDLHDRFVTQMRNILHALPSSITGQEEYNQRCEAIKSKLCEEAEFIENLLKDVALPIAHVHGDFSGNNIIYDDEADKVTLIDYELGGGMPAVFDFCYLLNLYVWSKLPGSKIPMPTAPESEQTLRLWMTSYLERKLEVEGHDPNDLREEVVDRWMTSMRIMDACYLPYVGVRLLSHLQGGVSVPVFNFRIYDITMEAYYERKPGLEQLKQQYIKQRSY